MKNFTFSLLILIFACITSEVAVAQFPEVSKKQGSQEIKIVTIDHPSTGPVSPKTRSAIPAISACLDFDMEQIEISFKASHGATTVYIINSMGQAIFSYSCDSSVEWLIYLPIPIDEGFYTLKIVSASAEYSGTFTI